MDTTQELLQAIHDEFDSLVKENKSIQRFYKRSSEGKASLKDVSVFSGNLGECASEALRRFLAGENLTDEFATDPETISTAVKVILKTVFNIVHDAAAAVYRHEDEKIGIGLNTVRPNFPEERVNDLTNKLNSILERDE